MSEEDQEAIYNKVGQIGVSPLPLPMQFFLSWMQMAATLNSLWLPPRR